MDGFLPSTLDGWLRLVVSLGGLLGIIWGYVVVSIRKPLEASLKEMIEQLNGFGGRVKRLEEVDAQHGGKFDEIHRHDELRAFQWAALSERMGKLEGGHEKLQEQVSRDIGSLNVKLASIESTLKFIAGRLGGGDA